MTPKFLSSAVSALLVNLMAAGTSFAHPPLPNVFDGGNRWNITGYLDATANHFQVGTQTICFLPYAVVGTSIQGTWFSLTFPDWNGRYYQEGDEIKMTGDYAKDVGHDHMTLLHTTFDVAGQVSGLAFKDWTEWREDGKFGNIIGWANAKMERLGRCALGGDIADVTKLTAADLQNLELKAQELSSSLPARLTLRGTVANFPGEYGQESVDDYIKRNGLTDQLQ